MGFFSGLGSSLVSGALGLFGGAQTNASNAKQLASQNSFNLELANTAHRRETKDLLAAGLNPILSGTGGSGAGGSAATAVPFVNSVQNGLNSAMDARRLRNENRLNDEAVETAEVNRNVASTQGALNIAQNYKVKADTKNNNLLTQANLLKIKADTLGSIASAKNAQTNNVLLNASIPAALNEAGYQKDVGKAGPWTRNLMNGVKDILGTANSAKSLRK